MVDALLIAGGSVAASLISIGAILSWWARIIQAPLSSRADMQDLKLSALEKDLSHNRANADQKFDAVNARLTKIEDELRAQAVQNAAIASSLESMKELFMQRFDDLDKRFVDKP